MKSMVNYLSWMEYNSEYKCFLLEDSKSVAALFELCPPGTEARPLNFMERLRDQIQQVLSQAFMEEDHSPWIVQFYLQDEANLDDFIKTLRDYVRPRDYRIAGATSQDTLAEEYLKLFEEHCRQLTQSGGLFLDEQVTGNIFQGKIRKVRAVIYRRLTPKTKLPSGITPVQDLEVACQNFTSALQASGVEVQRCGGKEFYEWMVKWFNPAPKIAQGDPEHLLKIAPYPGDDELPYGADFAESLFLSAPRSDAKEGLWYFDDMPHRAITVQGLRSVPTIGHMMAERAQADKIFTLFDRFPVGSVLAMTIVIKPQDAVLEHISQVKRSAVGDSAEAVLTREEADQAMLAIAQKNPLYPVVMTVYLKAKDKEALHQAEIAVNTLLISNGIMPIPREVDLLAQDSYLRNLPMCYDPRMEKHTRRARFIYSRQIANLIPLYGRTRGTGHPGITFFNRGGEPFTFDPLNKQDRTKNGHLLMLGPTGSGKSATAVYLVLQMAAIHNPRIFIIEAGNSFGLLGDYLAEQGKTVNKVQLSPSHPTSLNPFADALKVLQQLEGLTPQSLDITLQENLDAQLAIEKENAQEEFLTPRLHEEEESRDYLGEMAIAAQIMITGGEPKEEEKVSRQDRLSIRKAIILAAQQVKASGREEVITQDVVNALRDYAKEHEGKKRERAQEMADGMEVFCVDTLAASFFNRPGQPWPEKDVTILDMGHMVRDGYQDQLAIAYLGIMNKIMSIAEKYQYDARPTLIITDEAHIITTNPLLASINVKNAKMGRKYGAWFWFLTQNLADFPDVARKMLTLLETWICLAMEKDEVEQISRFKSLTEEQHALFLSARKSPGKYTEGVVLSGKVQGLFRAVQPPLCLAIAMTEQHEKYHRQKIMQEFKCSEVQATRIVAQSLMSH